jgi:4-hydroxy-tetrahydrodipicolinate synthase
MAELDLGGLWVPIVTPLTADGRVDRGALARLARRLLADGCTGLVALGTTGEPATLESSERALVIETCAAACIEVGKPLMVGVGSNCTRSTIESVLDVESAVCPVAVLVVVPYYTRPSEEAIVEHFRAVAGASATPVVVYNVPSRTGRGLGTSALLELAETPGVVGLKQAVGALDVGTLEVLRGRPTNFQVLAGDDAFIVPTLLLGGVGAIAASAHVCTSSFAQMVDAARTGRASAAAAWMHTLLPVVTAGFADPNPAGWKAALHALGEIDTPSLRPPMSAATSATVAELMAAIAAVHAPLLAG